MKNQNIKLVKKAINGNTKAFELLIKQHYEQLYRTAFLYVHNQEDSLDIVQETTYQALKSIHTLKNPEYFMTWLTRILIRCSRDLQIKSKTVIPLTENMLSAVKPFSEIKNEDSAMLLETIANLDERYRTAIILFYYHDHSIRTISELMEIPEGTVKTYLSRGKDALRKILIKEQCHG